jgi:hypothetical protein
VTNYTGLWKLLYDWQTIITGPLAILAAVIGGGMAYRAGRIQAKATRTAADLQVAAMNAQLARLQEEKEEAEQRADIDRQKREITQINVAISGMGYNIETLLHATLQYILPHHTESHLAYTALDKASGDPQQLAQLVISISSYRALVTICPEMHLIEWDFFREMPFIVEKDPELLKQTGWLISQSRELATAIKNRNHHMIEARNITAQQGGLKTSQFQSILHLQATIADAECIIALQLFELFLDIEKRLEAINDTYKIEARESKLAAAKPLYDVMNKLREIAKSQGGDVPTGTEQKNQP